jgi:glycosyltransferase involved in cell wall biosynthesis
VRVAYLVSRFPHVSETFIARELAAVSDQPGITLDLLSLFRPVDPTVHSVARPWVGRLRRPGPREAVAALAWWARRRPLRLAASVALVAGGYARHPAVLARALATVPLAAAHARRLATEPADHLHAHYATYPLLAAWLCHRLLGVSYSFTAHAHDLFVDQSFLRRRVSAARFVVAISEYNRRFLAAHNPTGSPVHVVHCGVDPSAYRFRPRAPGPAGPVRALCVASLQEYKGHRVLLEALAGADDDLARVQLDLVGSGPLREELERLAHTLGLEQRVRFHGGLPEPAVTALLDRADLFVLPSVVARNGQTEGIPVALMEALAAGVPAVASRLSGVPELVRDGETGLLAEPGSAEQLRIAIGRVLADPQGARLRAEAGRRLVEREFDVRRSAAALADLFRAAAAPDRPAHSTRGA